MFSFSVAGVPKGVKLSYLLSVFTDEKKLSNVSVPVKKDGKEISRVTRQLNDLTSQEFSDHCFKSFLMPRTTEDMFYSDYLLKFPPNDEKLVDYAQVYLTFELSNNFLTTMNTLRDHFNNQPDIYVSMENVTHKTPTKPIPPAVLATLATHKCKKCLKKSNGNENVSLPLVSPVSDCTTPAGTAGKAHDWMPISPPASKAGCTSHQCKRCLKKTDETATIVSPLVAPDSPCVAPGGGGAHDWGEETSPASDTMFSIEGFKDRIKRIHHVVVVMSPWNNMGFLQRTALLFEIYCAARQNKENNCAFDIALSWYDKKRLIDFYRKGGTVAIEDTFKGIDIGSSKCGFQSMRNEIINSLVVSDANIIIKEFLFEHLTKLTGENRHYVYIFLIILSCKPYIQSDIK